MLVVDKPEGPTSHDVVDRVRRTLGLRRVGHTGTLDPFATGVLPVCVGKATRLAPFLGGGVKVYEARVRLGFATTTDDRTGEPLGPVRPVTASPEAVAAACRRFVGELDQVPPAYSAKRVAGRRLYALARQGAAVERKPARVTVFSIEPRGIDGDVIDLRVRCSAGTYVRGLARDIGESLGTGGHLEGLRRTESGGFGLASAASWDDLLSEPALRSKLLPLKDLLPGLPAVRVGDEGRAAIRHGRDLVRAALLEGRDWAAGERYRVLGEDGALLALATPAGDSLHPHLVLVD
ncbi:MAG TPA: tRNA pseudouridine(55) synthase TruB [Vicinamibacteria bacterium]|nr:tRNA pseudouridine(55) synthase TruB [Vicinamibacteria bacterium]